MRSIFAVIEGLDGSGGTTQSRLLASWLEQKGQEVLLTQEPTNGPVGVLIRDALTNPHSKLSNSVLAYLFAADRRDHLDREIVPAIHAGKAVISDRYYHSSLAYQSLAVGLPMVSMLNENFRAPDIAFLLWLEPETSFERVQLRGEPVERFETLDRLRNVADSYETVYNMCKQRGENIIKIDATQSIEEMHAQIVRHVEALLQSNAD